MWRLKRFLAVLGLALFLIPALPVSAATNPFDKACSINGTSGSAACQTNGSNPLTGPNGTLTKVTKLISYVAGIAALIIVTIAGFMYVTSGGDPGKVSSAKSALVYAIVGIVVVATSQGIIFFVLNKIK